MFLSPPSGHPYEIRSPLNECNLNLGRKFHVCALHHIAFDFEVELEPFEELEPSFCANANLV